MSNNSSSVAAVAFCAWLGAAMLTGCGSESAEPPPTVEIAVPDEGIPDDPMSVIPDDIPLWESFDAKRILKQPGTNTLVVEGVITGGNAKMAKVLEAMATDAGWSTDTMANNEGLSTLIMNKGDRRLKVNLTQNGADTNVYLTTRLPE